MNVSFYTKNAYQTYPRLHKDIKDVKDKVDKVDSIDSKVEKSVFGSLPTVRRVMSLPDKIEKGDAIGAVGVAGLAVMNLPEDINDMTAAYRQIKAKVKGETFVPSYNYKEYQHGFSFFRGTMLHDFVDPNKAKNKELANKLLKADTTVADTKLGQKLLQFLGVKEADFARTSIQAIGSTKENPIIVEATKYEGSAFGKLTARALKRTTKIGAIALAAFELPKIFKAMGQGDDVSEKAGNTAKQTAKSAINVTSILAGIGYLGAIGSKKGPAGSLLGMGIGAVVGATVSNKIQDMI